MSTEHLWVAPGEIVTDVSHRVLLPNAGEDGFRLATQAEEGSIGSSELEFDDPGGDFYPVGLNAYRVRETLSDSDDPYLYVGHFGARREVRGPYRTGASRHVSAQLQDANGLLSRYVIRADEDGDRPQETDTERWAWLVTTSAFTLHFDEATSIIDPNGVTLSAADLTDYTLEQIIGDMAQQSGRNYYVFMDGSVDPPEAVLVYALDSGTHLTSDLRFSNVIDDVDDVITFYLGIDTELEINPERLASYVSVRYANGRVDENDAGTATEFSRVDRVMDADLIKTAAVATTRALQYLNELDTEETVVSGTVWLPANVASQFRAGMRCQMKATHLTGMADFVWVRLLAVTVTQISEDPTTTYALAFEGTFAPTGSCSTAITGSTNEVDGPVTGGPSGVGFPITPGEDDYLAFAFFAAGNNGTCLSEGGGLTVASPWTAAGDCQPPNVGCSHTESLLAYRANATGTPSFTWSAGISNAAADGRQIAVLVPGGSFVQAKSTDSTPGVMPWDNPLTVGNMVLLCEVAEGPSSWNADPGGADWTLIVSVDGALEHTDSNMRVWATCVTAENAETIAGSNASSTYYTHMAEVSFS